MGGFKRKAASISKIATMSLIDRLLTWHQREDSKTISPPPVVSPLTLILAQTNGSHPNFLQMPASYWNVSKHVLFRNCKVLLAFRNVVPFRNNCLQVADVVVQLRCCGRDLEFSQCLYCPVPVLRREGQF